MFNISLDIYSVDPVLLSEQSDVDLQCLLKRFQNVSADNKNILLYVIHVCALKVNRGQCIYGQDFHEMHTRLHGPKSLLTLYQIINKT